MRKLRPHKITPNIFPGPKLCKNLQLTFFNVSTFLKVESLVIIPYHFKVHMVFKPHVQQVLSDSYLFDFHFPIFFFWSNGTIKGFINHNSFVPCYGCTNKYNTCDTHTLVV